MRGRAPLVITLCLMALTTPAWAAEDEVIVAIEPGYERLAFDGGGSHALGATLSAWWGLSDMVWLMGSAGAFQALQDQPTRTKALRYEAFGGIVAALDVFRVIPSVEVGLGVAGVKSTIMPTVRLGAGLDYLLNPQWGLGAVVRYRPLQQEDLANAALTVQVRLSYRFEG